MRARTSTDNGVHGIFSDAPARYLGGFMAAHVFIHQRTSHWSPLSTWTRFGATEAVVEQLEFVEGQYRSTGERLIEDSAAASFEAGWLSALLTRESFLWASVRGLFWSGESDGSPGSGLSLLFLLA